MEATERANLSDMRQWSRPTNQEIGTATAVAFLISGIASILFWAMSIPFVLDEIYAECTEYGPYHHGENGCKADWCSGMPSYPQECTDNALLYCLYIPLSATIAIVTTTTLATLAAGCCIRRCYGNIFQRQWSKIEMTEDTL